MKSDQREATCCKIQNNTVSSFQCMLEAVGECALLQWITIPYHACKVTVNRGVSQTWVLCSCLGLMIENTSGALICYRLTLVAWHELNFTYCKSSTANTRPCPEQSAPAGTVANVYRANKESENIVTVNNSHYTPWTCITPEVPHRQHAIHKCKNKTHMPLK